MGIKSNVLIAKAKMAPRQRKGPFLPHTRIRAINKSIEEWVQASKSNMISGGGLYLIYKHHGVESPFDEAKNYQIFIKEGGCCLVTEISKSTAA